MASVAESTHLLFSQARNRWVFTSPFLLPPSSSFPPFKSVSSPAFVASPAVVDREDGECDEEEWKSKSEAAERSGTKVPGWYASVQMVFLFFLSPDLAGGDDDDDDDDGLFSLEAVLR